MSEPTTNLPESQPDPELAAGTSVGEYQVEGKIGQGAFGSVWKATHPLIGKVVAIKVLARRYSVDPEIVSRFVAEARAVNQIRHRNIIDIFSFGQLSDGRHYYVMEYLDGEPLDAYIERAGRLSLAEALPILRGIARALDAAHGKGIAHRDLKAENVFLATDADGGAFPKLLDFGIAKLLAPDDQHKHKTRTGTPVGTPYYMSPEQCRGRDVDHRTDFYAFGVLTHLLLTGAYPFDGGDHMSILIAQLQDAPPAASSLAPELPAAIDDAIAWLLAKDPANRPPTMRAAMAALDDAAALAGIPIAPPSAVWDVQTLPRGGSGLSPTAHAETVSFVPAKRSRARWFAITGVALVVAAALVVFVSERASSKPPSVAVPSAPAPSPSPTPMPTPPPPAPKADAPRSVIMMITGAPVGSEVTIAGKPVGVAPGPVQLPHGTSPIVLTIRAKGYRPVSRTLTPDREQTLAITLKRRPAQRPGKDDIIQVFEEK